MRIENLEISVQSVSGRFLAKPKGVAGIWGSGATPAEAIGELIQNHREIFQVKITILET